MMTLLTSLIAVAVISLISIAGIYLLLSLVPGFTRFSLVLVGIAVGSLLGDAFIHLLPEANRTLSPDLVSILVIVGILVFFVLEKIIRWRHCHSPDCAEHSDSNATVTVSVVGDFFHNFIDGILITSTFYVSFSLGLITAIAVLIHEIPQEIGDFGIYRHFGVSLPKAFRLNLFSALSSFLGVFFVAIVGSQVVNFSNYILPVTAGGFIYLAASDLIPELHRHEPKISTSLLQLFSVIFGVVLMYSLKFLE